MAKTAKKTHSNFAQTKETLGSIIFALILALVFRGFIGQAFVIPTGSMAPTLYGKHTDRVCTSCGYSFAAGLDRVPTRVQCPNCNHEDSVDHRPIPDAGDGIFTLSWPFAIGGPLNPDRWDVVVFKAPFRIQSAGPQRPVNGQPVPAMSDLPLERDGETNYIKRLIGLPGDIVEIIDGDVYVASAQDVSEQIRAKLLNAPLPKPLDLQERKELDAKLQIARKPEKAQDALWQVAFDADYIPRQEPRRAVPSWQPAEKASAWKSAGRIFRFDDTARAAQTQPAEPAPQFLVLTNKDFRDNYGYNWGGGQQIVSDLQLCATVNWQAGNDAVIYLCLSKYDDLYTIELRPRQGTGRAVLARRDNPAEQQEIQTWTFPAWKKDRPQRVRFASVDRRLQLHLSDRLVWKHDFPATAAQARLHGYEVQPPVVRIGAAGGKAELSHLKVARDVYYQDRAPIVTILDDRRVINAFSDKLGWATRDNPLLLRDEEYFVLGDNSPQSLDSRRWWQTGKHLVNRPETYRPGTVPADQMIGKAFFVYWPSWYRLWDIPNLRVIPNAGEMRWIH